MVLLSHDTVGIRKLWSFSYIPQFGWWNYDPSLTWYSWNKETMILLLHTSVWMGKPISFSYMLQLGLWNYKSSLTYLSWDRETMILVFHTLVGIGKLWSFSSNRLGFLCYLSIGIAKYVISDFLGMN